MVVLMDPMEDPDDILRANRSREKTYMFDVAFDYSASQVFARSVKSKCFFFRELWEWPSHLLCRRKFTERQLKGWLRDWFQATMPPCLPMDPRVGGCVHVCESGQVCVCVLDWNEKDLWCSLKETDDMLATGKLLCVKEKELHSDVSDNRMFLTHSKWKKRGGTLSFLKSNTHFCFPCFSATFAVTYCHLAGNRLTSCVLWYHKWQI